jgi:hypothetical protein
LTERSDNTASSAMQASAGLCADRDQQGGKGQCGGEQGYQLAARENCREARHPPDQRDNRNGDGRQRRSLIDPGIIGHEGLELAITAAARRGLDPASD